MILSHSASTCFSSAVTAQCRESGGGASGSGTGTGVGSGTDSGGGAGSSGSTSIVSQADLQR